MTDVGIVMPLYNQDPSYLRSALQSIFQQTYRNLLFVIVVDGADERTVQTLRQETEGHPQVKVIFHKRNRGISQALNTGFKYLLSKPVIQYLTWVSSDNYYYPAFIETLREKLYEGPPECGLVYSSFRHVDGEGRSLQTEGDLIRFRHLQAKPKEELLDICFIGVSFMYKKRFAQQIAGYHLEPVEDYEYWLRLTELCEIAYIPTELMDYRVNSSHSVSARLRTSQQEHRRWRQAFQSAKFEARQRRSIPVETTVIFPIHNGIKNKEELMETLLEQYYSNYRLLVIDLTLRNTAEPLLKSIQDPRTTFLSMPGTGVKEAVKNALAHIDTPYVMIHGPRTVWPPLVVWDYMQKLVLHTRKHVGTNFLSVRYVPIEKEPVQLRFCIGEKEPAYGEIYRTEALRKALSICRSKLPKVLVNSVPKSGTNLLFQIIMGIPGMKKDRDNFYHQGNFHTFNGLRPGEVATAHLPALPEIKDRLKGIKHLFISRDLRDVAVSWSHFIHQRLPDHPLRPYFDKYAFTPEERLLAVIRGVTFPADVIPHPDLPRYPSIYEEFRTIYDWRNTPDVFHIRFEDLISSPESRQRTIHQIIDHLWDNSAQLPYPQADLYQWMVQNIHPKSSETFRKGKVGSWREEFTSEHKAAFKEIAGQFLVELGYEKNLDW